MNLLSWIVLAAVILWFAAALRYLIRRRGSCSCGGGKNSCCGECSDCAACSKCSKH